RADAHPQYFERNELDHRRPARRSFKVRAEPFDVAIKDDQARHQPPFLTTALEPEKKLIGNCTIGSFSTGSLRMKNFMPGGEIPPLRRHFATFGVEGLQMARSDMPHLN